MQPIIDAIIPAHNEAETIGRVLDSLAGSVLRNIIVANNASSDLTGEIASLHGAVVIDQPLKGYGNACLAGIEHLKNLPIPPNVVVFLDADFSDDPADLPKILAPILNGEADLVIGSRSLGTLEPGAMTFPQKFGNWLATALIKLFWGVPFTDLGPFRAIRYEDLLRLNMADKNFGWTVEMQVKAAKLGLRCTEVPVNYRNRGGGKSKVSGTVKGTILAGHKILWTIFKSL